MILRGLGAEVGRTNRSKNEAKKGRHLGIDFWWILAGLGSQVAMETRPKIDLKRHRKYDEKMKGVKMAKKSQ